MRYSDIFSYKQIIEPLKREIDTERLPHAILFTEKEGYGSIRIALATIQYMFCQAKNEDDSCGSCPSCNKISKLIHPDLHFIFPTATSTLIKSDKKPLSEEFMPLFKELYFKNSYFTEQDLYEAFGFDNKLGSISVAEAEELIRSISLTSYEGKFKIVLILFPERMNIETSNKLLKSIEEPDSATYYFLISQNSQKIIPTILSRCRIIAIPPLEEEDFIAELSAKYNLSREDSKFWARYSSGSYGKAIKLINSRESSYDTNFINMLNLAKAKQIVELLEQGEQLATLGKEAQKKFCIDALETTRKLYMEQMGLHDIAYIPAKEQQIFARVTSSIIKKDFYQNCYSILNSAIEYLERNVNPKIIFCDMCNRLYYNM